MNDIIIQSIHIHLCCYPVYLWLLNDIIIQSIHNQLMFYNLNFVKPFYNFSKVKGGKMYHFPSEKKMKNKSRLRILSFIFPKQIQSINKYINGVKELPWPFVHWWWSGLDSQCNLPALFRTLITEIYFLCSAIITEKKNFVGYPVGFK